MGLLELWAYVLDLGYSKPAAVGILGSVFRGRNRGRPGEWWALEESLQSEEVSREFILRVLHRMHGDPWMTIASATRAWRTGPAPWLPRMLEQLSIDPISVVLAVEEESDIHLAESAMNWKASRKVFWPRKRWHYDRVRQEFEGTFIPDGGLRFVSARDVVFHDCTFEERCPPISAARLEIVAGEGLKACRDMDVGQLVLSELKDLAFLPARLCVSGDVQIEDCPRLWRLPDELEIEGAFLLANCPGLVDWPTHCQIGGSLEISGCSGVRVEDLPKEVRSLTLKRHASLEQLPMDLRVLEDLQVSECAAFKCLGVAPGGSLVLSGLPELTSIPNGLVVRGSMTIEECPRLVLAGGLQVGGRLTLRDLPHLVSIPGDLEVGGEFIIHNCSGLCGAVTDLSARMKDRLCIINEGEALPIRRW